MSETYESVMLFLMAPGALIGWAILLCLFAEAESGFWRFWMSVFTLLFGWTLASSLGLSGWAIAYAVAAYLPIGVVWSLWRYKMHVRKELEKDASTTRHYLTLSHLGDRVVCWVIYWPFSFVSHYLSDLFRFVREIITVHLAGVYDRILSGEIRKHQGEQG